jgi:dihydroorotate dehydrogenase (NAD+) catalytic subunit
VSEQVTARGEYPLAGEPPARRPELSVRLGGLELRNPVLLASGTCGYGVELEGLLDFQTIGGMVTKTVTLRPREGNPPPRIAETPSGMLNSIGLENVGIEAFVRDKLPRAGVLDTRIVVSIGGEGIEDYAELARRLDPEPGVDALELNLSCPNVSGGLDLSQSAGGCSAVVSAVRKVTAKPLLAKLTPNVTRVGEIARAAEEAGADAVSLVNTFVGMAIDIEQRVPRLRTVTGGLSGPAIHPLAVAKVYETARAVGIPVIGIGGITAAADVVEFLLAGASAVQVGTFTYLEPGGAARLVTGLADYLTRHGFRSPADLRGALRLAGAGSSPAGGAKPGGGSHD